MALEVAVTAYNGRADRKSDTNTGTNIFETSFTAVSAGSTHCAAITKDSELYIRGDNSHG